MKILKMTSLVNVVFKLEIARLGIVVVKLEISVLDNVV
jgi:hypothetical protein